MSSLADPAISEAWDKMKGDKPTLHWLVVRVSDDNKVLNLSKTGNDNFDGFANAMMSQEPGLFSGVFRVRAVDNRGSVQSVRTKFIRINIVSAGLPPMKRSKVTQFKPELDKICNTHLSLENDDPTRPLNKLEISKALLKNGGAHVPNSFDFGGGAGEDVIPIEFGSPVPGYSANKKAEAEEEAKKKAAQEEEENKKKAAESEAAAAAAKKKLEEEEASKKKEAEAAAQKSAAAAASGDVKALSCTDAWARVSGDNDPHNWVLLTYDGKNVQSAKVFAAGKNGLEEFKAAFEDDVPIFGGLRVAAVDDRGSVKSVRGKLIFVQYMPSELKPTVRAHAGTVRHEFEKMLHGSHASFNVTSTADLSERKVIEKLLSVGGAHKPNGYYLKEKVTKPEQLEGKTVAQV